MAKRKRVQETSIEEPASSNGLPDEKPAIANGNASPSKKRRVKTTKEVTVEASATNGVVKTIKKSKVKAEIADVEAPNEPVKEKAKRKRKTKEEREAEAMPFAARTVGHKLFIGAHVSAAGG